MAPDQFCFDRRKESFNSADHPARMQVEDHCEIQRWIHKSSAISVLGRDTAMVTVRCQVPIRENPYSGMVLLPDHRHRKKPGGREMLT